jgi:GNAT superfamily N-acetyltransferase
MSIVIRNCRPEDIPAVLGLVRELAVYEKAANEVEVTVAEMLEAGFGNNALFDCVVAEVNNAIVGSAITYYKYSTWKGKSLFLEDIIVTESHRRLGIGELLFKHVIAVAKEKKVRRLEWQVLEWNQPAINFYKKHNALFDEQWINCKLTNKELTEHNLD